MYCSTCGAPIPTGRQACDTCGTAVSSARSGRIAATYGQPPDASRESLSPLAVCPRCEFEGRGLPYFNRGQHVAALVGATLFTLPWALGAGGLLYYGIRHDHRICPRCGHGWGKFGQRAADGLEKVVPNRAVRYAGANEGVKRTWSVMLFILGAIMLTVGVVEAEAILLVVGTLAAAGGVVLHRGANQAREQRRESLMSSLQMPVLKLAAERKGVLTVTEVAAELGWSLRRAERVLQSLDDGWRVDSEVTDEGVIVYEFRELLLGRGAPPEEE